MQELVHDARLTLTKYGHVIDELDDAPRLDAETAIRQAREALSVPPRVPQRGERRSTRFALKRVEPRGCRASKEWS